MARHSAVASFSAGTQLVHGVGQFAGLALPIVALLLQLLALSGLLLLALIHNPKSHKPGEIGHKQHDPENLELHGISLPLRRSLFMLTVSLAPLKVKIPTLSQNSREGWGTRFLLRFSCFLHE